MTSQHVYSLFSFLLSVLFCSEPSSGSRVLQLACLEEGVAPVWFDCEMYFVCDSTSVAPLLEQCAWKQTFDLGSMRCQDVPKVDDASELHGQRLFPCRPWPGTQERYWFHILKVREEYQTADKAKANRPSLPDLYWRPRPLNMSDYLRTQHLFDDPGKQNMSQYLKLPSDLTPYLKSPQEASDGLRSPYIVPDYLRSRPTPHIIYEYLRRPDNVSQLLRGPEDLSSSVQQ